MLRVLPLLGVATFMALVSAAPAAPDAPDKHHNGHALIKDKLKTDGKHELHKTDTHTVHAHVKNGKLEKVTAVHNKTGKEVAVTKYKSEKKHHASLNPATDGMEALAETAYVGYGYTDGTQIVIYWFPVDVVIDGDSGAVLYVAST